MMATSPSGKARVCKTLTVGSIPTVASQRGSSEQAPAFCWRRQMTGPDAADTGVRRQERDRLAARLAAVVALLLVLAALRVHNLAAQDPFIDEGAHVQRARAVWSFEQNPGRFSNGKVLLYFWLGVFELPPISALWIARAAIALLALPSGAAVYALGRKMGGEPAGLAALGIYAVLPLALFFERMALADPLAGMFMTLTAWHSLAFARHPSARQAMLVGGLVAGATLAKLTMGLAPLIPAAATLLYDPLPVSGWRARLDAWRTRHARGLALAAGVVVGCWLPLVLPAAMAYVRGDTFTLVNAANMADVRNPALLAELRAIVPALIHYTSGALPLAAAAGLGALARRPQRSSKARAHLLYLLIWLAASVLLPLLASRNLRTRYFMPAAAPLSIAAGCGVAALWHTRRRAARLAVVAAVLAWVGGFALPIAVTTVTAPQDLALPPADAAVYLGGNFAGDAFREIAVLLDTLDPPAGRILADAPTCDALYFFTSRPVTCAADIANPRELLDAPVSYVVLNGHESQPDRLGLVWELVAEFERPALERLAGVTRTASLWRVRTAPAEP